MPDLIRHLATWVGLLLGRGGAHRQTGPVSATHVAPHRPAVTTPLRLPTHRSPYGLPALLDGTETVAVRPYVLARTPQELEAAA